MVRRIARSALILCGYLATALPSLNLQLTGATITLIWLPAGVALAALIRFGPGYWPAVALAALITGLTVPGPWAGLVATSLIGSLTLALIARTLLRFDFRPDFLRQRDLGLFAFGVPLGLLLSATLNTLVMVVQAQLPASAWLYGATLWWLGDVMGVVLIAPMLLALRRDTLSLIASQQRAVAAWLLLSLVSVWLLFFSQFAQQDSSLPMLLLPVPLVVWAAMRMGVFGASAAVLLLSISALLGNALGSGPLGGAHGGGQIGLWGYMATLALIGLMIAALQAERRSAEDELLSSQALLSAIRKAQARFIEDGSSRSAFSELLAALLRLTGSGYGFVAETVPGNRAHTALHTLALSGMQWPGMSEQEMQRISSSGLVLDNPDSLFGEMLRQRQVIISLDPANDPRRGGLPNGHPAMHNVMLMPLLYGSELLGAVALANRPGGFSERIARSLAPALSTTASLIAAHRTERDRERAEQKRSDLVEQLQKVTALVPGTVFQFRMAADGSAWFPFASAGIIDVFGVTPEQVRHDARPAIERIIDADRSTVQRSIRHSFHTLEPWQQEFGVSLPDGRTRWVQSHANPNREDDASVIWYGYIQDITDRRRAEEELRIAAIAFDSQEGLLVTDAEAKILRVNRAFTRITGYSADDAIGQKPSMLSSGRQPSSFFEDMWNALDSQHFWQGEIWNRSKDGEIYPQWLAISAVRGPDDRISHYVASLSDITQRKQAEEQIRRLAFFDPLTALPNRRLLRQHLEDALIDQNAGERGGALLFIDLDHFKTLNDTRGHDIGDQLLNEVGTRLRHTVRDGDVVARIGGDEFVVLLEGLSLELTVAEQQARQVAEKLREALGEPYLLGGQEHHSTPSIGISVLGRGDSSEDLLKRADLAMYEAKASGRNAVRLYNPAMQNAIDARAQLEIDLRKAIAGDQFLPLLQAQVDGSGNMIGAELLLHWKHPQRGMVAPMEFIPLAEDTGLIVPIGLWVIDYACDTLGRWSDNPHFANIALAVNVSAGQFRQDDFVNQVSAIVTRSGIEPTLLKLELTESLVLHDINDAIAKMRELRALGVGFAMDDFGIGQSSLASLKQLPLDQLKIDQSFVRDLETDPNDAVIVQTIIGMAASLGLGVIAEGVETQAQMDFLDAHGCNAFQGYLIGRPVPRARFEELRADQCSSNSDASSSATSDAAT